MKNEFHIPVAAKNGDWYISIWDYGSAFKAKPEGDIRIFSSDTQDMMCFNNDNEKCIDKKLLMRVENNPNGGEYIQIDNSRILVK